MEILYFLESIRTPFFDTLFSIVTNLGAEVAFLAVLMLVYWCIDKKRGLYMMFAGFCGTVVCQVLKMTLCVPRPFERDPDFTIVEQAREGANDYSFPSGHSQTAASTYGSLARCFRHRWLRWVSGVLIALVVFSRLYLGVHTIWDVMAGTAIGLASSLLLWPLFRDMDAHPVRTRRLFIGVVLVAVACTVYAQLRINSGQVTGQYATGTIKNMYTMVGASIGLVVSYFLDQRFIHMDPQAPLPGQVLKLLVGFGLVMLVRTVLKAPINALTGGAAYGSGIRYFIVAMVAGTLWPITFPLWKRVGAKRPAAAEPDAQGEAAGEDAKAGPTR